MSIIISSHPVESDIFSAFLELMTIFFVYVFVARDRFLLVTDNRVQVFLLVLIYYIHGTLLERLVNKNSRLIFVIALILTLLLDVDVLQDVITQVFECCLFFHRHDVVRSLQNA